ncbi:hypothetical protein Ciccas_011715, partial [Cichlidogyrus casuarinus]
AAKLEEEIRALEKFDKQFEKYQRKVDSLVNSYESRCSAYLDKLIQSGQYDSQLTQIESDHPIFKLVMEAIPLDEVDSELPEETEIH